MACGDTPMSAGRAGRIAIVAETAADARDVLVEGDSGIMSVHPPEVRPHYEPSKRRLTWPNGAVATLYNATEPDQLRGPQHDAAWCDELAKWQHARDTWDQLQFGLRIGDRPRVTVTTTPRPIPIIRELLSARDTVAVRGSTMDNAGNLAAPFLAKMLDKYEGTRLGRQELNAEILDDVPGALWTRDMLEANRVKQMPEMKRVIVAVDPSGTAGGGEGGDDVGIVIVGKGVDGRGYVLADWTCNLSPAGWSRRAVEAYHAFKADRIVAERNFGGAMVEATILTADQSVPVKLVTASRGKVARAEPVAALYEQGRISHVGMHASLEDQMVLFTPEGYAGEGSPDRADALVWGLSEAMLNGSSAYNLTALAS
jgi:phage terminase large subunit-like protein